MHICVSRLNIIGSDNWLVAWTVPSHYLNQCSDIVNWTSGNKLQWNFDPNSNSLILENAFLNVMWKMASILSWPKYVKHNEMDTLLRWFHTIGVRYMRVCVCELALKNAFLLLFHFICNTCSSSETQCYHSHQFSVGTSNLNESHHWKAFKMASSTTYSLSTNMLIISSIFWHPT